MYTQKINRSDPDKAFTAVLSAYATADLTVGQAVVYAGNGTNDGIAVTRPATALNIGLFAGIVTGTVSNGSYGAVQCWGYNTTALISGSTDVAVGNKLAVKDAVFNLIKEGGTVVPGESGLCIALQAYTTTAAAAKKVWIRAM
jgi:hypothetical protein